MFLRKASVSDADKATVGFDVRRQAMHFSQPPDAPRNLRLKSTGLSGRLLILLGAVLRATMYEVEHTQNPVNGPWVIAPAFNSTRGMNYYVRVRAVAAGQNYGPWSDVAVAMAV